MDDEKKMTQPVRKTWENKLRDAYSIAGFAIKDLEDCVQYLKKPGASSLLNSIKNNKLRIGTAMDDISDPIAKKYPDPHYMKDIIKINRILYLSYKKNYETSKQEKLTILLNKLNKQSKRYKQPKRSKQSKRSKSQPPRRKK